MFVPHGEIQQHPGIKGYSKNEKTIPAKGILIPYVTDVKTVLDFLSSMYKHGFLYSGICTARSALSGTLTLKNMRMCQTIFKSLSK